MQATSRPPSPPISAGLINLLAACGRGGGGGSSTVPPDAQPITPTGQLVTNQAIQGATVCLDLNANQQCDSNYTDANNYSVRRFESVLDGSTDKEPVRDLRAGLSNGSATSEANLYSIACLTPIAWVRCGSSGFAHAQGAPNRAGFCGGGQQKTGFYTATDIAGQPMGPVIRQMQVAKNGSHTLTLDPAMTDNLGFPAGSMLDSHHSLELRGVRASHV